MAKNPIVTITMKDGGVIKCELYPEIAPESVNNFISLINKHFYDEKGVEVNVEKGEAKTAVENTAVSELYKDAAVKQTVDGKTYVYVSGLTTVTDNLEKLTKILNECDLLH